MCLWFADLHLIAEKKNKTKRKEQEPGAECPPSASEPSSGPSLLESSSYAAHVSNEVSRVICSVHCIGILVSIVD